MNSSNLPSRASLHLRFLVLLALGWVAGLCLTGCGKGGDTSQEHAATYGGGDPAAASSGSGKGAATAKVQPELPTLDHPASPAEAARYIDLSTLPAMQGADEPQGRAVANLSYRVAGSVKVIYEFHKNQLLAQKWKELSEGTSVTDEYASGTFERCGFHLSMLVSPGSDAGKVDVTLHNYGNVDLAKLPLPPGTTKVYAGPITAMHATDAAAAATAADCRKLVLAQGWEPYGGAGDSAYFRRNGVQLQINAMSAPAQGGKTMITYSCEQMSADMPAPPDAEDLRYADTQRHLTYSMPGDAKSVAASYKEIAIKSGWKPNRDETFRDDDKDVMVFRNPAGDMMWMEIKDRGGKSAVTLKYQTGAEIAAMDAKMDAQAAAYKAKMKADLAKPTVELKSPPDAKMVSHTQNEIHFTVPPLRAKAIADEWNDALHEYGWLVKLGTSQGGVGTIELWREGQMLTINYRDSADTAGEITVTSSGVGVEAK